MVLTKVTYDIQLGRIHKNTTPFDYEGNEDYKSKTYH